MPTELRECPHCGSNEGYYEKNRVSGEVVIYYNFDGSAADNSDMYDYLSYKPKSKYAFCAACNKRLFKLYD